MNKDIFEENERNIRVFGLDTQKKLFESEVLIMNISTMMCELCKNLILSGVGLLLFNDGSKIDINDYQNNFFYNEKDSGKNKVEVLKEKIKEFKESCKINIINDINEIKNRKIKYSVIDLSENNMNEIKDKIEKIMIENKGILYYIKIINDKAIFLNNILEKKFLEKKDDIRFVKDEIIIEHMDLSDDDNDDNEKKKEEKKKEEKKLNNAIEINNDDDENNEKKIEILKEDDYIYLEINKKINEIKNLIPKNIKKNEEETILYSYKLINDDYSMIKKNPFNNLCNYIIGGVVCHEIINCISRKKNPRTNIYYYDAFNGNGKFLNELYDKSITN